MKHILRITVLLSAVFAPAWAETTPALPVTPQPTEKSAVVPGADALPTKESVESSTEYRSMMYSKEELDKLQVVMEEYHNKAAEDVVEDISGQQQARSQEKSPYYTYPQFFLSTIIYYNPGSWTVWVNGERITQDSLIAKEKLAVQSVSAKTATFVWQPGAGDRIKWDLSKNGNVIADAAARTITFTLRANQTFSTYKMDIIEGRVQPATIDTRTTVKATNLSAPPSIPGIPPPQNTPLPSGAAAPSGQGLEGLMNRYQQLKE